MTLACSATTALILILFALPLHSGWAQDAQPSPGESAPPRLEPVIVEEGRFRPDRRRTDEEERLEIQRTPGAVDLIGETTIRESRGANLRDALEFVPGVIFRPRFGAADEGQLSIRGSGLQNNFHLRGVNVLIDGFLHGNADGFSDFESIELLTTKRIEIYRGASGLRYGANTIGGALNFVTKTGYDVPLVEVRGEYGSFGFVDVNLVNNQGRRGTKIKDNINRADLFGLYLEEQLNLTPTFLAVAGSRIDYSTRSVENRFTGATDHADYLGGSPKLGFVWAATPTAQVFANASRAYQPPLLLEATAPGQIGGDLDQLEATKAWQFEVGTRGSWGKRLAWDIAAYDIELWDEIQNVNVQPFPAAPFTIPRFQNIPRSRHTGVEVGLTALLATDVAPALGLGQAGDALRFQTAYTWGRFVYVNNPTFNNNQIPGLPEHLITAMLRYDHASGFFIAPYVEAVPRGYFVNSENTVRTPPYALANIQMGYTYAPWKLSVYFEGRNLGNVNYVSSVVVDSAARRFFEPGDGTGVLRRDGMELVRNVVAAGLLVAVLVGAGLEAAERPPGPRLEIRHPGRGHDVHVSAPALAVAPDGQAVLSWFAQEGSVNHLFVQSLPALGATPVRVNPDGLTVASLHQAPGLVVGRRGEVYVTWSSPRSDGVLSRKISGCPDRSTAGAPSTITCA